MNNFFQTMAEELLPYLLPMVKDSIIKELEANPKTTQTEEEDSSLIAKSKVKTLLDVSDPTLWRWEKTGYLVPVRIGGKVFYNREDIDKVAK